MEQRAVHRVPRPVDILVLSCGVRVDREAPGLSSRTSEQVKWSVPKKIVSSSLGAGD